MSNVGGKVLTTFREKFTVVQKDLLRWFPGHMSKSLRDMQQVLKNVDCVIEVHDARLPLCGRQADFRGTLTGLKPHILVLNKKDLADLTYKESIVSHLKKQGLSHIFFTNVKDQRCSQTKKILPRATELIRTSHRYNRAGENSFTLMIIGVPNVGKSSLINRLRHHHLGKAKAARVGGIAGITRALQTRIKISEDPNVYLLDTPGILSPSVTDINEGLKLALAGCLQDHLVGYETLADYLLFWMNKHQHFEYVKELGLPEPNDNISYVLTFIAAKYKKTMKTKDFDNQVVIRPDFKAAAEHFLSLFRTGTLGRFCLDEDSLRESTTEEIKRFSPS